MWLALGQAGFDDGADAYLRQNSEVVSRYLIATLRKGDSPFWKPYVWLVQHAPGFISDRMLPWVEPRLQRIGATYWLAQMGPRASVSVPELRRVALDDRWPDVRGGALWALGRVDGPSKESVAVLLGAMGGEKDAHLRQAAVGALEVWAPDDPAVIATLINGLKDTDPLVRQICAAALGKYGARALKAVGPLTDLSASDDPAADYAARALDAIRGGSRTTTNLLPATITLQPATGLKR